MYISQTQNTVLVGLGLSPDQVHLSLSLFCKFEAYTSAFALFMNLVLAIPRTYFPLRKKLLGRTDTGCRRGRCFPHHTPWLIESFSFRVRMA